MSETNLAHANLEFKQQSSKILQPAEELRRSSELQAEVERIGKANTYLPLDRDTELFDWFDDQRDVKLCGYVTSATGSGLLKACQLYRTQYVKRRGTLLEIPATVLYAEIDQHGGPTDLYCSIMEEIGHPLAHVGTLRDLRSRMQEFDRLAWDNYQELAPGQKIGPGKSIVFALTKNHAARLTRYLNELHPECKGNYAQVITSDVANADDLIRQFKDEKYPQVAVSVDMLNTGFNCREVLHLVMCRTVRSPILYQQIRGRGTRTAPHIDKQKFVIYDFFGNHEYFNDSDTDIYADTGRGHISNKSKTQQSRSRSELIELGLRDRWQQYVSYVEVGTEGERVDKRDYVTNWEQTIQSAVINDPTLQKIRDGELLTETEETELVRRLNTPRYYFNEDNLKRAYRSYNGNLIDFIRAALGILKLKSQEELLEENFRAWLVSHSFAPAQAQYLSLLKNRGIAKGQITIDDLFLPPLSVLNAAGLGIELFGEQGLRDIFEELNRSVFAVDATGTEG